MTAGADRAFSLEELAEIERYIEEAGELATVYAEPVQETAFIPEWLQHLRHLAPALRRAWSENERLREALEEITKGVGVFSRDPLEHAENTIEDMKELARSALHGAAPRPEEEP